MPNASQLRAQIEATLAERIPCALTPLPRIAHPVEPTGITELDHLLRGGFPVGALSEIVGPECSGRTSLALNFVARLTQAGKVCAWVDVSDALHPESAAAQGVDLERLLWIRCGVQAPITPVVPDAPLLSSAPATLLQEKPAKVKPGIPQAGSGHPRMEANGLSTAVSNLLSVAPKATHAAQVLKKPRPDAQRPLPQEHSQGSMLPITAGKPGAFTRTRTNTRSGAWSRLEQALRVTDLLLQAGGFSCIVLDLGSLNAEFALRVPLATWFRFRAGTERLQSHFLLLSQHACSRNSAGLVLRLEPGRVLGESNTLFTGMEHRAALDRQRFAQTSDKVLPLRKQPQSVTSAQWQGKAVWAGRQ